MNFIPSTTIVERRMNHEVKGTDRCGTKDMQ